MSDICYVVVETHTKDSDGQVCKRVVAGHSFSIPIDEKYYDRLYDTPWCISGHLYEPKMEGHTVTLGELLHQEDPTIDPQNWMKTLAGIDRDCQIKKALGHAVFNQGS